MRALSARLGRRSVVAAAVLAALLAAAVPAGRAAAAPTQQAAGTSTVGLLISSNQGCTATVVTSRSRSLAVTAAHCVYYDGGWHLDDARLLPGYHDQQAPYGQWTVRTAWVPIAWQRGGGAAADSGGQPVSDVAFLQLAPDRQGRPAQDVLGSHGIRFDARPGDIVTVLGYPGEPGFDGQQLVSCSGATSAPIAMTDGAAVEVACHSGEGASGGPWLIEQDTGAAVAAVLSSGNNDAVYGHLFDADTEQLYRQADQAG